MRSWATFLFFVLIAGFAAAGGCTGNGNGSTNTTVTIGPGVGAGGGNTFGCNGNGPDGYCNLRGNDPESCTCPDCEYTASCRGVCPDDGQCTYDPGAQTPDEDCTCDDCYGKVTDCPPASVGCPDTPDGEPPTCTADEDCTCADCTNTPRCTDNCIDNGSCVEYLEGCSCADCVGTCNGNPATTSSSSSSSSSGGGGGAGGMSGVGGAGGN